MKKEQFLKELRSALSGISESEREDILRDQEEYIRDAVAAGRNEESVIQSLGSVDLFVKNLSVEAKIQSAENASTLKGQVSSTFGAVFAILALAPLNLIFVFGPFMGLVGLNIAGWAIAFASLTTSLAGLGVWGVRMLFIPVGFTIHLSSLLFFLGAVGLSLLGLYLMFVITRLFLRVTVSYLKWNLSFVKGKA